LAWLYLASSPGLAGNFRTAAFCCQIQLADVREIAALLRIDSSNAGGIWLMKTINACMECQVEFGIPRFSTTELAEIPDDGVLWMTCDRGHRTAGVLQNERYEILAGMAVEAIVREHYRDAVGSFASSLERLWEFYVQAVSRRHDIPAEKFTAIWKPMANSSERQIGAFVIIHALEANEPAPLLPNRASEFRNKVIHKGYLPSRDEAIDFGQAVADCAYPVLRVLGGERFKQTILDLGFDLLRARGKSAQESGCRCSTVALGLVLQPTHDSAPVSIKAAVEEFAARPDLARAVKEAQQLGAQIDPR
jgi:hypothetical protein